VLSLNRQSSDPNFVMKYSTPMVNQDRLIDSFCELSLIDGIFGKELDVARELFARLEALGLEPTMDEAGKTFGGNAGNVRARLDGASGVATILLCSHMDTIQSTKNLKHVRRDGMISSAGTTILGGDDRSGLAVILEILQVLRERNINHGPIEVLFTVAEESGMHGAKFISRSDFEAEFGFVFDCQAAPGNYIVEAPGAVSFTATVRGRSAHAAVSPEKGVHAIQIASRAIAALKLGRWDHTGMLNIGTIEGGTAINVVPDRVKVTGETRNANESKLREQVEYIRAAFNKAASDEGGCVDIDFFEKYAGYQFAEDNLMIKAARAGIAAAGLQPTPLKYPGGSDANVLNKKGIPVLNLGVGFKNAHSYQECIAIRDLVAAAEIGLKTVQAVAQVD
jgi:tripeptide aminopeptidase